MMKFTIYHFLAIVSITMALIAMGVTIEQLMTGYSVMLLGYVVISEAV